MQLPKPPWILFNLFRITAIVFLVWALVAQFVALGSDIKEQSQAKQQGAATSSQSTTAGSASSRTSSSSSPSLLVATSSRPASPLTAIRTLTATTTPQARTTRLPEIDDGPLTRSGNVLTATVLTPSGQTDALVVPLRRWVGKRAEAEPTSGTYGLTSIPTSPGGVLFAAVSRMLMVLALSFLLMAQLGLPEMWLYRHTPIFGPQSTPLWLGIAQVVVAVENLRVYSTTAVWTAHTGLLVIGMINAHLALFLIFLARRRKLPKQPPPALYFSHVTRLLFFRPPPPCYLQLLEKADSDEEVNMKPANGRGRGLQVSIGDPEIGGTENTHTAVRQGGYPTFSRGGLGAPGSQIPFSRIDPTNGGLVRGFTAPPPADARSVETGDAYSGVADDESRASSFAARNASVSSLSSSRSLRGKRKPTPLGLDQPNSVSPRQKQERQRNIETLREKLNGRLERNGSAGSAAADLKIGHPVLQRSASDLPATSTRMAHVGRGTVSGSSSNEQGTVVPSIPKRSNTLDQPSAGTPHLGSARTPAGIAATPPLTLAAMPPARPEKSNKPPPKSPAKSIAGTLYSSILPWTKASRPTTPLNTEKNTQRRHDQPQLQTPLPPVKWPEEPANNVVIKRPAEDVHQKPRPQRVDELSGNSRSASPSPELALARSDSGSKLMKRSKTQGAPSPTPLKESVKPPTRSDTLPTPRSKPTSYADQPLRQASTSAKSRSDSPLTAMIESIRAKTDASDKRESPMAPKSPSPPVSPPVRPVTTQSMYPNPALRSSMAQLQRSGSTRSARSARTAMGVRFDLEKRHSSSESLLSPGSQQTSTPRSAGFRIPGTKLTIPFPSTARNRFSGGSTTASTPSSAHNDESANLMLEMKDADEDYDMTSIETDEIEAARPESVVSLSSVGSTYQRRGLGDLTAPLGDDEKLAPLVKSVAERAGLPKRANTVLNDPGKQARRSHRVVLGGEYLDGGDELEKKRGHVKRPSSVSIDSSGRINV